MHRRFRRTPLIAAAVGALVALAGCSGGNVVDTSVDNSLGYQPGGNTVVFAAGHRYQAGDVSGETLNGGHFDVAQWRGKVVVVNFWGQWCADCRAEAQAFATLARQDAAKGVRFLGIDERDSRAAALAYTRRYHVGYPSLFDPTEAMVLQFPHAVPAATPTTIVLDRSGRIAAKASGSLDYTHLRSLVNSVLREQA
ncbi:MAG TPA: TlpA disulfide reductase family protein [Mycobacteriales bacterium]|nr:TlpA disulfide reductase family protein [Mycobacteriales bacterium]